MTINGIVVRGKGEGRTIGYPTANLDYDSGLVPEKGVWICRVILGMEIYRGLAIIGKFEQVNHLPSVEVHIFGYSGDLYGQQLSLALYQKLRDLEQFPQVDALVAQIKKDLEAAERIFRE